MMLEVVSALKISNDLPIECLCYTVNLNPLSEQVMTSGWVEWSHRVTGIKLVALVDWRR